MIKTTSTQDYQRHLNISIFNFLLLFLVFSAGFSQEKSKIEDKEISHAFYITSNVGNDEANKVSQEILDQINIASQEDKNATLLIVGNLTNEKGYPSKEDAQKRAEEDLKKNLLTPIDKFNGRVIFTPGVNEWNKKGHKSIDDLESFLQDNSKAKFWPNDGCPIDSEEISDDVVLVMIDSQWYLENWDDHPYINNKCDIKTREQFFAEFKDELKDNYGKTVIVAIHHPILSRTRTNFIDKVAGFSDQSFQNSEQSKLHNILEATASGFDDVIFVSGHDRNLQYLDDHDVPQIISGAAAKTQKATAEKKTHFASRKNGYAKLIAFKDGSSLVKFYETSATGSQLLFEKEIKRKRTTLDEVSYKDKSNYGKTAMASIYTKEETDKSRLYKWAWGDHYRDIYSKEIEAPVLFLDDLPGNIKPISEGGGNQSRSLRLINDNENEYTLRAVRKSAIRFIQNNMKEHYVADIVDNTVAERIVLDYYTTAHPYAPYALNTIMDDLDMLHVSPKIYYVPKQERLGVFNDEYGDELYMLEEHVGDENKEMEIFGKPDDILSSSNLREELLESKDASVDEDEYIKARIFDMLVGDWDRHDDQWRWAEFKDDEDTDNRVYKPIPRDRDQPFSKYDGPIIALLKLGFPPFRAMQSFDSSIKSVKWFNTAGYAMDKMIIQTATWEDWEKQVKFIQENLTDNAIKKAFTSLPEDVKDESLVEIQENLKIRRDNLMDVSREYYEYLNKFHVITGTDEDDKFLITRKKDGITEIQISENDTVVFQNSYNAKDTKEIWIYGLDGNDEFIVEGNGNNLIKLKVLGGEENDIYNFKNSKKTKLYDYKSKKNTIIKAGKKWLVDSYEINNYNYEKRKTSTNSVFPTVGYSSDAGVNLGLSDTYTTYGLAKNPFTTQHTLGVNYFFDTEGLELSYFGEFAHIFYNWNLGIEAYYTSPNFTLNYFGKGNDTFYDEDAVDLDYNRVNIEQWHFAPSLIWSNKKGSEFVFKAMLESLEVSRDTDRFIGDRFQAGNDVFDSQMYAGAEVIYHYLNKRKNPAFPNLGMEMDLTAGYKTNIDEHDNELGYLKPSISVDYPLHKSGILVLATKIGGEVIISDKYEFYHGAMLGGNESLRAFRNERFNGKSSFYQSTDIRIGLGKVETSFMPLRFGLTGGFDYGRIWEKNDDSKDWHTNYGGSIFVNGFSAFTGNVGYYTSDEGSRVVFTFGFKF